MSDSRYKEQIQLEERTKEPPKYKVILLNDDYTTFDFVISVLVEVFRKPHLEAIRITMDVHKRGYGLCGVYTKEIAETKVATVHQMSESAGYPLRCVMEEE
ncbi:MAG: ATP-dependent Clp protease adaptor ClpS [Spirochaetales bacterium]|nr:ATP-dependent Clp protease adaptor ClpS [Spirochaetales bacterium]